MKRRTVIAIFFTLALIASFTFMSLVSAARSNKKSENHDSLAPQSLLVEDFNYSVGALLTANGWTGHSAAGTNAIAVTSPGLTYSGYASSGIGNAVTMTTSGEDDNRTFATQSSGSVYAGVMVNITDAAVDPANIGGYFFHLGPDPIGTTFRGRVFIKKDASNNISFGITKAGSTVLTDITYTPFTYSLNTTYLLVVKYTIIPGTTNDTVDLFINPALGGAEPAPTISAPDTIAADINPGSVALRQGTSTTHPTVRADGIRVSNSWSSLQTPVAAPLDFNGDGRTDFVVTRDIGGLRQWWIKNNGVAGESTVQWGLTTDQITPADYDGDGKTDIAIWREAPATQASFYILQSSNNTLQQIVFGQTGDRPTTVRDYDGDGKADASVYRPGAQGIWFYRGTLNNPNNNITYIPWGTTGDVEAPGDYDGDGKGDFCIRRNAGGQGIFYLAKSTGGVEYVNWGLATDAITPGDYDGDGKMDFAVARPNGANYNLYILERDGGGTGGSPIIFALTNDEAAFGDFDGDGKMDIGIWRENADPTQNFFWIRQSSNGAVVLTEWGQQGDRPIYDWNFTGGQ